MQELKGNAQQAGQAGVSPRERRVAGTGTPASVAPVRRPVEGRQPAPARAQSAAPDKTRRPAPAQTATARPAEAPPVTARQEAPATPRAEAVSSESRGGRSPFLPILGLALTLLLLVSFQMVQLFMDRDVLVTVKDNQNAAVSESRKVRTQFESIVKGTGQLAANGNVNAQRVVAQLRKQGVTINMDAATAR